MTWLRNVETVTGTILALGGGWQFVQAARMQPVDARAQLGRFVARFQWGGLVMIGIATAASFLPDLTREILAVASIACTVTAMVMRYRVRFSPEDGTPTTGTG